MPAKSGKVFGIVNPATGETIAEAADAGAADIDIAVKAASQAQKSWKTLHPRERGRLVGECGRLLAAHSEEIARLVALETGKALRTESRVEAGVLADVFTFFGGLGGEIKGETVPFKTESLTITQREPLGVVGAIIPWNVPLMLMALKIAPAMVAGNAVIVKSAEEAPLAVLRACQIMNQVLPAGVLNILSGDGPGAGGPLVAHKGVNKVTFTGSVETGKIVYRAAAEKLIPVTLELGGKSPMIVMGDADLDKAVAGAITGMRFTRQGQSCTAASRIFIHSSLHDAFLSKLKAKVDAMVMGDPLDEKTDIGAIISVPQFDKVKSYIALGEVDGTAHRCSALPTDPKLAKGLFVQPVIFTGVSNDHPGLPRRDLRAGHGTDQIRRVRGCAGPGQRHRVRPRRLDLDQGSADRARRDPAARSRRRPGQPEHGGAGQHVLWRREELRPRQGSLARIHARALHDQEDHHLQPGLSAAF